MMKMANVFRFSIVLTNSIHKYLPFPSLYVPFVSIDLPDPIQLNERKHYSHRMKKKILQHLACLLIILFFQPNHSHPITFVIVATKTCHVQKKKKKKCSDNIALVNSIASMLFGKLWKYKRSLGLSFFSLFFLFLPFCSVQTVYLCLLFMLEHNLKKKMEKKNISSW